MVQVVPTEAYEQEALAKYLDDRGYLWCHVPNGGLRDKRTASILKRQGVKAGIPDILIFDKRIAIELKRQRGGRPSPLQKKWIKKLEGCGWTCFVAYGAQQAIDWLENDNG